MFYGIKIAGKTHDIIKAGTGLPAIASFNASKPLRVLTALEGFSLSKISDYGISLQHPPILSAPYLILTAPYLNILTAPSFYPCSTHLSIKEKYYYFKVLKEKLSRVIFIFNSKVLT